MAKYRSPAGMIVRGWTVALDPAPEQAAVFRRDCGARRFAYNWAVAQIKRSFEAGRETGDYDRDVWSGWALRNGGTRSKATLPRGGRNAPRRRTQAGSPGR